MERREFIILEKNEQAPMETMFRSDLIFRQNDDNTLSIVKNRWIIKTVNVEEIDKQITILIGIICIIFLIGIMLVKIL